MITIMRRVSITPTCRTKRRTRLCTISSGFCKLKGGDYEAALAAFQAGLEVEGNTATQSLMFNELVAYEYLGQYDKAKLAMDQYLALYPDDEKAQREAVFLQTR